jgi:esterase/lipase superfamily enzyme
MRCRPKAAPSQLGIAWGSAIIGNLNPNDPGSGTVTAATVASYGDPGPQLTQALLESDAENVVVFIHGAANSFQDSIIRAAFDLAWIQSASGRATAVLVFSWPTRSYQFWKLAGDYTDYRADQHQAQLSAPHVVEFLQALYRLRATIGGRRLSLMAHSMGNYCLGFGVQQWFATPRNPARLFDDVVLAAADEPSNTFGLPNGARLSDLWLLCNRINVYFSGMDVLMELSHLVNGDWRLGHAGPANLADTAFFPPGTYTFLNCTQNQDYLTNSLGDTHQYYRESASVRPDIARVLARIPGPPGSRGYDPKTNTYKIPLLSKGADLPDG